MNVLIETEEVLKSNANTNDVRSIVFLEELFGDLDILVIKQDQVIFSAHVIKQLDQEAL